MKFENKKNEQIESIRNKQTLFLQRARNQAIIQLLLFWQIGTIAFLIFYFSMKMNSEIFGFLTSASALSSIVSFSLLVLRATFQVQFEKSANIFFEV